MQLGADNIKKLIAKIGFTPQNGKNNVYCKTYPSHDGYVICIDLNKLKIEYYTQDTPQADRIKLGDGSTSNFSHAENFVVLECVDRLLKEGYTPSCIELEKTYPSGRGHSGRLDILIYNPDGSPFLMIECKTWGAEYEKEYKKMLKDGGQLFTYYTNDRAAKFLCLYSSRIEKSIEYKSAIIDVDDSWLELSGAKEIYEHWNKNFKDNGIFESHSSPYDIKHKALTFRMLRNLKEEDSGKIYHQIMEILRHNAISDKPNAFNKLLNLFVCKIIDENKNEDDELKFQWLETDTDESLQMRLNDLYKEGMWRFLEIRIIDYEEKEVTDKLENIENDDIKQWVMKMYQDTRLKKSPNFAFVEVQDEKTFQHNAKVVREIVELLQVYKFRYEQKHEFLGNFFELLLNTSMKQEAGQFFTPAPITRFIISSLPLRELVQKRVDERIGDPLPTIIDYACGSGHFLTEYMSQLQEVIDTKVNIDKALPSIRNQFQSWQGFTKFLWAKDTVYGIDFDNRLVKTTKVSAFFNGDGEATIVWANGLDNFSKSDEYRGKLKHSSGSLNQYNGQFDILISNPPYSVEAFKSTIQHGDESFELYKYITDNSSEIECLFVERMKQLLKVGGWVGIILPSSMLSNGGIHSRAREIIFKYFNVKAIVELGSGTFMETGTNTIIMFLERRSDNDFVAISKAIDTFFTNKKDVTVSGIENAFSKYLANTYNDCPFKDYMSFINRNANDFMKEHNLFTDYARVFGDDLYDKAFELEKEKMLYFLLTYSQNIVLVKTGNKPKNKHLLGYEFSKRRGHEGLKWLSCGTKLYDDSGDLLNPNYANSYIYNAFLGKIVEIDKNLTRNVSYGRMSGFIEYGTNKFDKVVNLGRRSTYILSTNYKNVTISSICTSGRGRVMDKQYIADNIGEYPVYSSQTSDNGVFGYISTYDFDGEYITWTTDGAKAGTVFYRNGRFNCTNVCGTLKARTDVNMKYLASVLALIAPHYVEKKGNDKLMNNVMESIKIPLPPLDIQQIIVAEMETIGSSENDLLSKIENNTDFINGILLNGIIGCVTKRLGNIMQYSQERVNCQELSVENYVGVDNLLPNIGGKRDSQFLPSNGTATAYKPEDILLSNIRPYLKKIWFANNVGGSSNDVLVLTNYSNLALSEFVYYCLATDAFFDYEMQNVKGIKMPRADKDRILDYQIPLPSCEKQNEIVENIKKYESEIGRLNAQLSELKELKDKVLQKYL